MPWVPPALTTESDRASAPDVESPPQTPKSSTVAGGAQQRAAASSAPAQQAPE